MLMKLFGLLLVITTAEVACFGDFSIRVTGRFLCKGKPINDYYVAIYEDFFIDYLNQRQASINTDRNGTFDITAHSSPFWFPRFYLEFRHPCHSGEFDVGYVCRNYWQWIPKSFVTYGYTPEETYDIGNVELFEENAVGDSDC